MTDFTLSMKMKADARQARAEVKGLKGDLTGLLKAISQASGAAKNLTGALDAESRATRATAAASKGAGQATERTAKSTKNAAVASQNHAKALDSESNAAKKSAAANRRAATANDNVARATRKATTATRRQQSALKGVTGGYQMAQRAVLGFTTALGAAQLVRAADSYTRAENRIRSLGKSHDETAETLKSLYAVAGRARANFGGIVDVFARLSRATERLGLSQAEVERITETVSKSFQVTGASAQEAAAGTLQLTQALASGILQGDELRSIRENAPLLAQAIADEFGVTIGELKELGANSELTADRIVKALSKIDKQVDSAFNSTTATVEQSLTLLGNATIRFIGLADNGAGASAALAGAIQDIALALDGLAAVGAPAVRILGGLLAARVAGIAMRFLATSMLGTAGVAAAMRITQRRGLAAGASIAAMGVKARIAGRAMRGLTRGMALLGGPVGIAVAVGLTLWEVASAFDGATKASNIHRKSAERVKDIMAALSHASGSRRTELEAERKQLLSNAQAEVIRGIAAVRTSRARLQAARDEFDATQKSKGRKSASPGFVSSKGMKKAFIELKEARSAMDSALANASDSIRDLQEMNANIASAQSSAVTKANAEVIGAIDKLTLQTDAAERLTAAKRKGVKALIQERAALKAESIARELGIKLSSAEGQAILALTLRREQARAASAASAKTKDNEKDKIEAVIAALTHEQVALVATEVQLNVLNALRRAGIDTTGAMVTATGQLLGIFNSEAEAISRVVVALHAMRAAAKSREVITELEAEAAAIGRTAVQLRVLADLKRAGLLTDKLKVDAKGQLSGAYDAEAEAIARLGRVIVAAPEQAAAIEEIGKAMLELKPSFERAREEARRWRDEMLDALDKTDARYAELAANIETVYAAKIKDAQDEMLESSKDWADGVKRALNDIVEESADGAKQMEDLTKKAFRGMEDALVEFAQTGKLSFSDLVDSIISDVLRMVIRAQITGPLAQILGGGSAGGGGGGGGGIFSSFLGSIFSGFFGGGPVGQPIPVTGANIMHTGGTVGDPGVQRRSGVPSSVFAGAQRLHGGGIAGLKPGEVPTILKRYEKVSTPRQWDNMQGVIQSLAAVAARPIVIANDTLSAPGPGPALVGRGGASNGAQGASESASRHNGLVVNIIDQRGTDSPPVQAKRKRNRMGNEVLEIVIPAVVTGIQRGQLDDVLGQRFSLSPQGART